MEGQAHLEKTVVMEGTASFGDIDEHNMGPVLVGVAGGSASGKTTLCNKIIAELGLGNCSVVSLDSFYFGVTSNPADYNFDHPDALDWDLCFETLKTLREKKETSVPIYNFGKHAREPEGETIKPSDLILFEGILALHDPRIVNLMNFKIFVQCDDDVRLFRRLLRDVKERKRDVEGILYQYNRFVKPAYDDFIKPSAKFANIIVPGNSNNDVAIKFIIDNLHSHLSHVEQLKSNMTKHPENSSLIDERWLKTDGVLDTSSKLSIIFRLQKVFLPIDETVKAESLNIFSMFSQKKFSKTLYRLYMGRLVTYGVKMMMRYKERPYNYRVIHYTTDLSGMEEKSGEQPVEYIYAIIVPVLTPEVEGIVKKQIEVLEKKVKVLEIFVLAVFATMDNMIALTEWKENIFVINNVCVMDADSLLKIMVENCRSKEYDLNGSKRVVDALVETGQRELDRVQAKSNK